MAAPMDTHQELGARRAGAHASERRHSEDRAWFAATMLYPSRFKRLPTVQGFP
jgi:hypothetical protein